MLMTLQVLILGSLCTYRALSTDFNGVVVIISGYEVLIIVMDTFIC